jgi:hypothetical protein
MAAADVAVAKSMGWGPGAVLVSTETLGPLAAGGGRTFEVVFQITRVEGDEVYAKLLYEDGQRAATSLEEPLCLTVSPWRAVTAEAMGELQGRFGASNSAPPSHDRARLQGESMSPRGKRSKQDRPEVQPGHDDEGLASLPPFAPPAPSLADFESGKSDTVIITRSGATGISLHAPAPGEPSEPGAPTGTLAPASSDPSPDSSSDVTSSRSEPASSPRATPAGRENDVGGLDAISPDLKSDAPEAAVEVPETDATDVPEEPAPEPGPTTTPHQKASDTLAPGVAEAIRAVVEQVLAERGADPTRVGARLSEDELAQVARRLRQHSAASPGGPAAVDAPDAPATLSMAPGQRVQLKGAGALVEGVAATVGGAMAAVGAAGRLLGAAGRGVADGLSALAGRPEAEDEGPQASASGAATQEPLPSVLPRLSEYRLAQLESAARTFAMEQDRFWTASAPLTVVREEIERIARERGLPVQDVVEKMKPDGELADLRQQFNEAVAASPDSGARKKAMDKALDSYIRQYGRAQEEVLNPEQIGNPHYEGLKARLSRSHEGMESKAAGLPAFTNSSGTLEPSHFEKLKEAVARMMEKIKEVLQDFKSMLSGRGGDDDVPGP